MKQRINTMGLSCPQPVILTKQALESLHDAAELEVLVDNEAAVSNVMKFAKSKGLETSLVEEKENQYLVNIKVTSEKSKGNGTINQNTDIYTEKQQNLNKIVVISSDKMGEGDETLGKILIKGFIFAMTQLEDIPKTILLYNGGAKLSIEGSECLKDLLLLESLGSEVLTCGTCLKHYGIEDKLGVGSVTNMYTIAEKMSSAIHIIKP